MNRWILYTRRFDKLTGELPKHSSIEAIYQGPWTYRQVWKMARRDYPWLHSSSLRIERE
jgi:hypothetical protein